MSTTPVNTPSPTAGGPPHGDTSRSGASAVPTPPDDTPTPGAGRGAVHLQDTDAVFGNLVVSRQKDNRDVLGLVEVLVSSILQFQPCADVELYDRRGQRMAVTYRDTVDTVASRIRRFDCAAGILTEETVAVDDTISVSISLEPHDESSGGGATNDGAASTDDRDVPGAAAATVASRTTTTTTPANADSTTAAEAAVDHVVLSGGILFSPEGVPYHWRDERNLHGTVATVATRGPAGGPVVSGTEGPTPPHPAENRFHFAWGDIASVAIDVSRPVESPFLAPVTQEELETRVWFASHNLKTRRTYWVPRSARSMRPTDTSSVPVDQSVSRRFIAYGGRISTDLREPLVVTVTFSRHQESSATATASPGPSPRAHEALREEKRRRWKEYRALTPVFSSTDAALERVYEMSWYTLFSSRVDFHDPRFPHPFTSVNKFHYFNQFFWDSAYHAVALQWHADGSYAEDELKNFVVNQFSNGMIPYELFLFTVNQREWMASDGTSTTSTQPPVISVVLPELYRRFGNRDLLSFFYRSLVNYEWWLWMYRDLAKRGLSSVTNIWETGWDNSPRLDGVAKNRELDPWIEEVDFNVFVYRLATDDPVLRRRARFA